MPSTEITFGKCIKCNNKTGPKKVQYKQCSYLLHQKCTSIISRRYSKYFKSYKRDFICPYSANYLCLTCDKHVYDK